MSIIGITGPSGSGKSTALYIFKEKGFEVLDCDVIYKQLLAKDESLRKAIKNAFPTVFNIDGSLNRKKLSSIVFSNVQELATLNSITYPYVESYVKSFIATSNNKKIIIEAINLIGYPIEQMCDRVIVIIAEALTRIKRVSQRDDITMEEAMSRFEAQDFSFDMSKYLVLQNNFDTVEEWFDYLNNYFKYL